MKTRTLPENTAIRCETEPEYQAVLDALGISEEERSRIKEWWGAYEKGGFIQYYDGNIMYGHYLCSDHTIIPASEWLAEKELIAPSETKPAWTFQTEEDMETFLHEFSVDRRDAKEFLEFKRKPEFELITADGVKVNDPKQTVWKIVEFGIIEICVKVALKHKYVCFSTREAAISHRQKTVRVLCLNDFRFRKETEEYFIPAEVANNLLKERLNDGK